MDVQKTCFIVDKDPLKDIQNKFKLENKSFIDLVVHDECKVVFSCETLAKVHYLYVVKEGYVFYTISGDTKTFEEFRKPFIEAEKSGFKDATAFQDAQKYGISDYEEYMDFKNSDFYGVSTYKDFLHAKEIGFDFRSEYLEAKKLEIPSKKIYDEFKDSGFSNYNTYEKAKKGGFPDAIEYNNALQLGITSYDKYIKFLDKKYKEFKDKLSEISKQANSDYKSGNFEAFLKQRLLLLEEGAKMLYLKVFSIDLTENPEKTFEAMVKELEGNLNEKLINFKAIKKWQGLIEQIKGTDLTIEKKRAEEAKEFFDKSQSFLKKTYESI